jgi:4-amino-4-deoxy-L-arabinose transferase-like glycosyltransferase
LAALTKPFFLAYPVIIAVYWWLEKKDIKQILVSLLTVVVLMATVIAPWTYRNYQKFSQFIPVSSNGGYVLYLNNNSENYDGGYMRVEKADTYAKVENQIKREPGEPEGSFKHRRGKLFGKEAKNWIIHHPTTFAVLGFLRVQKTFFKGAPDLSAWAMNHLKEEKQKGPSLYQEIFTPRRMNAFLAFASFCLYILSTFGFLYVFVYAKDVLLVLFRRREPLPPIIVLPVLHIAFFIAVYFVFEGQPRYSFPILFMFTICLAAGLHMMRQGVVRAGKSPVFIEEREGKVGNF